MLFHASLRQLLVRHRAWRLRLNGMTLAKPHWLAGGIDVRLGISPQGKGSITLRENARLETGVVLHAYGGNIRLGRNLFVGPYTVIYGHGGVEIGDDCLIAMHCRIVSSNHAIPPFGADIQGSPDELRPTKIGRDVWLGAGVTVLGGVTIADGCIVGAGSVVTRDLPAGAIAYGAPAVIKSHREGSPRS